MTELENSIQQILGKLNYTKKGNPLILLIRY